MHPESLRGALKIASTMSTTFSTFVQCITFQMTSHHGQAQKTATSGKSRLAISLGFGLGQLLRDEVAGARGHNHGPPANLHCFQRALFDEPSECRAMDASEFSAGSLGRPDQGIGIIDGLGFQLSVLHSLTLRCISPCRGRPAIVE
jgi:hypothetical protein